MPEIRKVLDRFAWAPEQAAERPNAYAELDALEEIKDLAWEAVVGGQPLGLGSPLDRLYDALSRFDKEFT